MHLKAKSKHFYAFTLNYLHIKAKGLFADEIFEKPTATLQLVGEPGVSSSKSIRTRPNEAPLQNYEMSLYQFVLLNTMVTDDATVMARVANASVSRVIHIPDKIWLA